MTTVFPAPVAILQAYRGMGFRPGSFGKSASLGCLRHRRHPLPGPWVTSRPQRLEFVQGELGPPPRLLAYRQNLLEIEDGLDSLQLAEEQAARPILPPPVTKQLPGRLRGIAPTRLPPAPNVLAQGVDERQIVPLLLGQQQCPLRGSRTLGLEPVARLPARRDLRRPAGLRVVEPVLIRLAVGRAEDRVLDRLDGDGSVRHGSVLCWEQAHTRTSVPGSAGFQPATGRRPAIVHAGWKSMLPGKPSS